MHETPENDSLCISIIEGSCEFPVSFQERNHHFSSTKPACGLIADCCFRKLLWLQVFTAQDCTVHVHSERSCLDGTCVRCLHQHFEHRKSRLNDKLEAHFPTSVHSSISVSSTHDKASFQARSLLWPTAPRASISVQKTLGPQEVQSPKVCPMPGPCVASCGSGFALGCAF